MLALASAFAFAQPPPHLALEPIDRADASHRALLLDDAREPLPWAGERISWMFWRTGDRQENRHQPTADSRDGFPVELATVGASVVGLELDAREQVLDRAEFDRLAQAAGWSKGAKRPAIAPDGRVSIQRSASLVTIVRPDASDRRPSPISVSKLGVRAEIRPLMDPTTMGVGGDLPIRVYVNGSSVAGQRVVAIEPETGTRRTVTTRQDGFADVRIARAGLWRLEFHRFETREQGLELISGVLSFAVPTAEVRGR